MNVCIFGDSVAKGVVYDEVRKKYIYLKDGFSDLFSQNQSFPIKNYARFGCTIMKGAEILKKHQSELPEFNYTVLEFGGNDCDFNWAEVAENPSAPHSPNVPLDRFEKCYSELIERVKASGSKPVILSLPPLDAERFFNWISKGLSKENLLQYLGDIDYIYRWHESYSMAIKKLAQKYSVPFIDIRAAFLEKVNYKDFLCKDGMHPNEKGHALIAQTIQKHIPLVL